MDKLVVLWTSGDLDVAEKMVHMYVLNAKIHEWWQVIDLIIWGPSAKLLSESPVLKENIQEMIKHGINVMACKACTDSYNVTTMLRNIGIEIDYMGETLTEHIKSNVKMITI